eukprot:403366830
MSIHQMEKLCYEFMKIILNEQVVKAQNIPEKDLEYFQIVVKKLVTEYMNRNGLQDYSTSSSTAPKNPNHKRSKSGIHFKGDGSIKNIGQNSHKSQVFLFDSPFKNIKPGQGYDEIQSDAESLADQNLEGISNKLLNKTLSPDTKSPMKLKESMYSRMSKKELIGIIDKQKLILKELNEQQQDNTNQIESMRYGYMKELANLRDQVVSRDQKGKKFEYIEVYYFQPTESLNEEMCFVLNKKLEQMKELYEASLQRLQMTNHNLQQQINLFLKLGEDGNIGIRFNEMDADSVIRKLNKIEKNPRVIWKAFDEYYGYGFFFDVLEYEFGITPETHHKLIERFDQEISQYKNVAVNQISSITEKNQSEIDRLRKDLEDKNLEFSMIKQKHLVDMDRMKKDITEAMDVKCQGMLAAQFRKFDEEKAEFFEQIRELEQVAGDYKKVKRDFDMNLMFTKWLYIAKIRSIKSLGNFELKAAAANEAERQMHERDFQLQLAKNPNMNLKEELQDAKNEITELCQQISDLQYSQFSLKKDRDYLHDKLQEIQLEADKLKQDYEEAKQKVKIYQEEYQTYRTNFESSQKYVKTLETEVMQLKQKVGRLNEIAEQFMQNTEQVDSAFSVAATVVQKVDEMYHEKMKDKGTLTTLFGLNKVIDKKDDEKRPSQSKGVQASKESNTVEMQTEVEEKSSNAEELLILSKNLEKLGSAQKEQLIQSLLQGQPLALIEGSHHQNSASKRGGRGMRGRGGIAKNSYLSIPGSHNQSQDLGNDLGRSQGPHHGKTSMNIPQHRKLSHNRRGRGRGRHQGDSDNEGFNNSFKGNSSMYESQIDPITGAKIHTRMYDESMIDEYGDENVDQFDENYQYGGAEEEYDEEDQWERGSNLMDALDGDPELKRQISDEVNKQYMLELKMEEVQANSKEVQYSKASSRVDEQEFIIKKGKILQSAKIQVPFALRNMERILHRGYNLDKKDAGIQTEKINWYQMIQKENQKNGFSQIFESMDQSQHPSAQNKAKKENKNATQRETSPSNPYGQSSSSLTNKLLLSSARQSQLASIKQSQLMKKAHHTKSNSLVEYEINTDIQSLQIYGKKQTNPQAQTDYSSIVDLQNGLKENGDDNMTAVTSQNFNRQKIKGQSQSIARPKTQFNFRHARKQSQQPSQDDIQFQNVHLSNFQFSDKLKNQNGNQNGDTANLDLSLYENDIEIIGQNKAKIIFNDDRQSYSNMNRVIPHIQMVNGYQRPFTSKLKSTAAYKLKKKLHSHNQSMTKEIIGSYQAYGSHNQSIDLFVEPMKKTNQ